MCIIFLLMSHQQQQQKSEDNDSGQVERKGKDAYERSERAASANRLCGGDSFIGDAMWKQHQSVLSIVVICMHAASLLFYCSCQTPLHVNHTSGCHNAFQQ